MISSYFGKVKELKKYILEFVIKNFITKGNNNYYLIRLFAIMTHNMLLTVQQTIRHTLCNSRNIETIQPEKKSQHRQSERGREKREKPAREGSDSLTFTVKLAIEAPAKLI